MNSRILIMLNIVLMPNINVHSHQMFNYGVTIGAPHTNSRLKQSLPRCFINNVWTECLNLVNDKRNMLSGTHIQPTAQQNGFLYRPSGASSSINGNIQTNNKISSVMRNPLIKTAIAGLNSISWPFRRFSPVNMKLNNFLPVRTKHDLHQNVVSSVLNSSDSVMNRNLTSDHISTKNQNLLLLKKYDKKQSGTNVQNLASVQDFIPVIKYSSRCCNRIFTLEDGTRDIVPVTKSVIFYHNTPSDVRIRYDAGIHKKTVIEESVKSLRDNNTITSSPGTTDTPLMDNTIASSVIPIDIENIHGQLIEGVRRKEALEIFISTQKNCENATIYSEENTCTSCLHTKGQRTKFQLFDSFIYALDEFERTFYTTTFNKLTSISPLNRRENGISFVQSGLFLSLQLMALSTDVDEDAKAEIHRCLGLNITETEKLTLIRDVMERLPESNDDLKFRRVSRLVLGPSQRVGDAFRCGAAEALRMQLTRLGGNETDDNLAASLNRMVEHDSGGAIRDTFEPEELSTGVRAVALTTLYLRARWRASPTALNGSRPFRDCDGAPARDSRMIRINDVMRYARFEDWHFQALEISYATPGLSLLLLIPDGRSLRRLAHQLETTSVAEIISRMASMRVAVTMPQYTLRMTLLLPSKLQSMGINKLISEDNSTHDSGKLKLSHAVQRIMFWAEAGRYAFKDDGIEWDEAPELELVVDRPYIFFVRFHNVTLMNGNFVL